VRIVTRLCPLVLALGLSATTGADVPSSNNHSFEPIFVPEPSTAALLLWGASLLAVLGHCDGA
jgi:hypothetical protein